MKAFVYGEFNQNAQFSLEENNQKPTLWADFISTGPVEFKYGISFIDLEQAKCNQENEIPEWDFDEMKT
jgi:putative alpha-1,2-mannosidase